MSCLSKSQKVQVTEVTFQMQPKQQCLLSVMQAVYGRTCKMASQFSTLEFSAMSLWLKNNILALFL